MSNIKTNAIRYLKKQYPHATTLSEEYKIRNSQNGTVTKTIYLIIAQDWHTGIKQILIAINDFGFANEPFAIASNINDVFEKLDTSTYIARLDTKLGLKAHEFDTNKLVQSPKIIIYTNAIHLPVISILDIFRSQNLLIDIVEETKMYNSLFISYGGPDENYVSHINEILKSKGIQTWFFPTDALPGQKLRRIMHDFINKYDRVLLVCSKASLERNGVLIEIERVLERETREGGVDILIPITLGDFVYSDWAPQRKDIADQIRSRVISRFPASIKQSQEFQSAINN